jgi:hypothetical protein
MLRWALGAVALGVPARALLAQGTAPENTVEVWKTATCGCCKLWVDHMRAAGFRVTALDVPDVGPFKRKLGIPPPLESCHTGVVAGYAIEGHIPADVIRQMLKQKPKIAGIAVPGMPLGSPGMEQGGRIDKYDILSFDKSGKTAVFASRG